METHRESPDYQRNFETEPNKGMFINPSNLILLLSKDLKIVKVYADPEIVIRVQAHIL